MFYIPQINNIILLPTTGLLFQLTPKAFKIFFADMNTLIGG